MIEFVKILALTAALALAAAGSAVSAERPHGPMSVAVAAVPVESPDDPFLAPLPAPSAERAQIMGGVCRWGAYWCWLAYPMAVGAPCCCPTFCGTVTMQ